MDQQQKNPQTTELGDKQRHLLGILAETPNVTEAARQAGIGRSTAQRWLRDPAFKAALSSIRQQSMEDAMNSVHSYTAKAVEGLVQLMDSQNEWLRRMACLDILSRSLKIREVEAVEERLSALEKALEKQNLNAGRKS